MTYALTEYRLVCYEHRCSCGSIQRFEELHCINQSGNAFNEVLTKPHEPIYALGEIYREHRTSQTRACLTCIDTAARSELPEMTDPKKIVGHRITPKLQEINIEELEL